MLGNRVTIGIDSAQWEEISLTDRVVSAYSLEKWAREFWLMTAGYRDTLDPRDAANPDAPFNLITVAICAEAKARVFKRRLAPCELGSVLIGGEVRPHTQDFIKIAARVYGAHGFQVHLRKTLKTTPIWYSSFGIFFEEFQSGDNFTASHSQFFKGGWKPLDAEGKQLLEEEDAIVAEVRALVSHRDTIRLSPWRPNPLIVRDFDVDDAYVAYQRRVFDERLLADIRTAGERGFKCSVCPLGGSMMATSGRLFAKLGISTGEGGIIRYFMGEEDSCYHNVGQVGKQTLGVDPSSPHVYRGVGAQQILQSGHADMVLIWDPDGDRLNVITRAPACEKSRIKAAGLEVDEELNGKWCVVYFTPNQLYLMLAAFRIEMLRSTGELDQYNWFIGTTFPSTHTLTELAHNENLPCLRVPVGFKYIGTLCKNLESQLGGTVTFTSETGESYSLGTTPRALILCEESGGANLGGTELLRSKNGVRNQIALREKDGMQIGLLAIALAASLFQKGSCFAEYYCDLTTKRNIRYLYNFRKDVRLYDESLLGDRLKAVKDQGFQHRDRVMVFFQKLAEEHRGGRLSLTDVQDQINSKRPAGKTTFPVLRRICKVGDGVLIEADSFRFLVRASGTDALLRYYAEGTNSTEVQALQNTFINLKIA